MLTIATNKDNGIGTIELTGELDTNSANDLQQAIDGFLDDVNEVTIDMKNLSYITSAGLRILLTIEQTMEDKDGSLTVTNVCDDIMDVFEVSGFTEVLNIQ